MGLVTEEREGSRYALEMVPDVTFRTARNQPLFGGNRSKFYSEILADGPYLADSVDVKQAVGVQHASAGVCLSTHQERCSS